MYLFYTIMKMHVPNNISNPPLTKSAQHNVILNQTITNVDNIQARKRVQEIGIRARKRNFVCIARFIEYRPKYIIITTKTQ